MVTKDQVKAAMAVVLAVGEAIRDLGEVPSGHLYAQLMGRFSLAEYEKIIDTLIGAGLVEKSPMHVLKWVGPSN
jgi:hypothetical protein